MPSLASGNPGDPPPAPVVVADWPADWREKLAGDDKGFLNQLKRYNSPLDVGQWLRTTAQKIAAGELKPAASGPPKDATPEQLTAWRKEQNLPVEAGAYVSGLKLKDGVVPGEADKPLLEAVGNMALGRGYTQDQVNDFVGVYYDLQDSLLKQRKEFDGDFAVQSTVALQQELGNDFKPTMNALRTLWVEQGTPEVQNTILTARTADGRVIGDIPDVVKFLGKIGRELNPAAAILPSGHAANLQSIANRKTEIEGMMYVNGKQNPAYYGNEAIQQEYRDLISAEERMKTRAA